MFNPQNPEILELNRQRKMADLLTSQGMQNPQGQTVAGGVYVPPNPMEYLAKLFSTYAGTKANEKLDAKEVALAKALREQGVNEVNDILTLSQGRQALPSQELAGPAYQGVAPSIQYPAVEANSQAAMAKALTAQSPQAQTLAAPLMQNLLPKKTEKLIEYDTYLKEGGTKKFTDWSKEITPQQEEQNKLERQRINILASNQAQSRVPMGYRMLKDGTLEAIPGGPADIKAQTVNIGKETVDTLITGLKDKYNLLKESGGITSTSQGALSNIPAYLSSTGAGQATGKLFATENQSARNTIAQSRPLLLQAIARATGMSSKQMDSNTELQMYLKAATDPSLDYEANMTALNQLQDLYGIGGVAGSGAGTKTPGGLPSASDIDAEIARRQNKNKPR